VVSSARTDEVLKVIVANPIMIEAYKAGVPGNGQPFPDGSKIAKLRWKPKRREEHGGSLRRRCARRVHAGFRHRKGQQEIFEQRRMGIRAVQLRSWIGQVHGRSQPLRLRSHLPSVSEALNRAPVFCRSAKRPFPSSALSRYDSCGLAEGCTIAVGSRGDG